MLKNVLRYWIDDACWVLVFVFFIFSSSLWAGNWKSAIVLDKRGRVVYSYHPNVKLPPASTVKILTAMVVIDHVSIDKWVTISPQAASVEPSKCYLRPGEQYKVRDLIYAMLMASANDAAVALAEAVAGSESKFAGLMNAKAKRCGARYSRFITASGLPAKGQVSTAKDMAKIMRVARHYGLIVDALSKKVYSFRSQGGRVVKVVNHNKFLWNKQWSWIKGKTGFTSKAKQCFLGFFCRSGMCYSFCFLGGRTLWDNIKELVKYAGV